MATHMHRRYIGRQRRMEGIWGNVLNIEGIEYNNVRLPIYAYMYCLVNVVIIFYGSPIVWPAYVHYIRLVYYYNHG